MNAIIDVQEKPYAMGTGLGFFVQRPGAPRAFPGRFGQSQNHGPADGAEQEAQPKSRFRTLFQSPKQPAAQGGNRKPKQNLAHGYKLKGFAATPYRGSSIISGDDDFFGPFDPLPGAFFSQSLFPIGQNGKADAEIRDFAREVHESTV
jgi:hypothetical protein